LCQFYAYTAWLEMEPDEFGCVSSTLTRHSLTRVQMCDIDNKNSEC